eukprot:m.257167 g.257167  ORF g.257167 m.257167 type:complete len:98 (+) comp35026_c0_seq1:296-589(+)
MWKSKPRFLIDFDNRVNLANKRKTSEETDCTRHEPEKYRHDEGVTDIQNEIGGTINLHASVVKHECVGKHVERARSRRKECAPPPMIILCAKVEVSQ